MCLFRPGPLPSGVLIDRPDWPCFEGTEASGPSGLQLPGEIEEAPVGSDGEDVLNQAHLQAAMLLQEAAARAEAAVEAARKEGFEEGRQAGLTAGQAELEDLRQQALGGIDLAKAQVEGLLQVAQAEAKTIRAEAEVNANATLTQARDEAARILEEAREEQRRRVDTAQGALVDLAVAAAVRLVQGHLAVQPGSVVAMVAAGVKRLKDTNCTVRVAPQDLPLLEAQRSTLERELGHGLLQLQPEFGLPQGSYTLSSPAGQVDARLDQQAFLLRTALQTALQGT